jgi:hypothetical protein
MSKPIINAQIVEINDGPYFNVTLYSVPRIGELIHLYSLVDAAAKRQTDYFYEVVRVLHKLFDVPENLRPDSSDTLVAGSHHVIIVVKRSKSNLFEIAG